MISSIGTMNMGAVARQRPPGPPPKPEEMFQSLDVDESGALDLEELQAMAEKVSEMTGVEMTAEDLMAKMDTDGNGSLEVGEMEPPEKGEFRGPPPFLAEDGSVQNTTGNSESFNPLDSLLSYLSAAEEEASSSLWSAEA
jgi:EF-hand domain pair